MISVCMNCQKRAVGCRTDCPEWAAEKAAEKQIRHDRYIREEYDRYESARIRKNRKTER